MFALIGFVVWTAIVFFTGYSASEKLYEIEQRKGKRPEIPFAKEARALLGFREN
jgi:membrane protein DedA with SNARE-associated domain